MDQIPKHINKNPQQQINQPPPYPYYYDDDEITLKELILKIIEFWKELKRNWWLILLFGLIGGAIGLFMAWRAPITYSAGISFLVNDNKSSTDNRNLGAYVEDYVPLEKNKIVEIATSGRIIHAMLLTQMESQGKTDFIANHIIDLYGFQQKWAEEKLAADYEHLRLSDVRFNNTKIENFSIKELRTLGVLTEFVVGSKLKSKKGLLDVSFSSYDKRKANDGVFTMKIASPKEDLLLTMMQTAYERLVEFCIEESVGRPQEYFKELSFQVDSLKKKLDAAEYSQAYAQDRSKGLISNVTKISKGKIDRKLSELSAEYNELKKNKEAMEFVLNQETPGFQVIDQTYIPIEEKANKSKDLVIGLILGGFLASIFIIGKKIIADALS